MVQAITGASSLHLQYTLWGRESGSSSESSTIAKATVCVYHSDACLRTGPVGGAVRGSVHGSCEEVCTTTVATGALHVCNACVQAAVETWARLLEHSISTPAGSTSGVVPLCRVKLATSALAAVLQRLMGQPLPGGKPGVPRPQCIAEVRTGPIPGEHHRIRL